MVAGEGVLAGVTEDLHVNARTRLRISVIDRYLRPPEVKHLFSEGDLLLLPYRKRCKSPLTDLAAAFGVPVLRSDRVQGAGFRDGEHGLTYPHGRPELLAGLLSGLALDRSALESLGGGDRRRESVQTAIQRLTDGHRRVYRDTLTAAEAPALGANLADNALGGGF